MGVHGLWKLIDKAGRPIPVETLEGKVLAIDVSIWLYQLVRGYDSSARPGSNSFLLGLFHRICKLLFYRIKPVFVFDGGVPSLKKKTIAARQKGRKKAQESIEKVRQQLLENLIKRQALGDMLGEKVKIPKQLAAKQDELFWLPPEPKTRELQAAEESDSDDEVGTKRHYGDLNSVDINSDDFKKLPAEVRHDILTDLKETRKLNSWARIHLMPEKAVDFSSYQMSRLLKRRAVQESLDQTAEELGVRGFTVQDLKNILTEQGVDLSHRIASDNSTRFIYASSLKETGSDCSQKAFEDDEDDPQELIRPKRRELLVESDSESESENDILPALRMMAESDNDLSQQEILELIRQQKAKTVGTGKDVIDLWRAGTSKQNDFTSEENAGTSSKMADLNESRPARGNSEDNENPKLEPGKIPEDLPRGNPQVPHKNPSANQLEKVSPHKNGTHSGNESCKNREVPNETPVNSPSDWKSDLRVSTRPIERKSLEIFITPNEPVDDDIFADVFAHEEHSLRSASIDDHVETETCYGKADLPLIPEGGCEVSVNENMMALVDDDLSINIENAVAKTISEASRRVVSSCSLSHEPCDSVGRRKMDISGRPSSPFEPTQPLENDIPRVTTDSDEGSNSSFDLSSPLPEKKDSSLERNNSSKTVASLEIFVNPNEEPEDDIFADIFSQPSAAGVTEKLQPSVETCDEFSSTHAKSLDDVDHRQDLDEDISADVFLEPNIRPAEASASTKTSNPKKNMKPSFLKLVNDIKKTSSARDLNEIKLDLEREDLKLSAEGKREERLSSTITEQITQDAQSLLELFGIPYLIAPMEAEAQCAYLDLTGQTEGTITDDSDIWLFGARNVYKNFFDQRKFVKQFKASDIFQCYRLNRDDLIMIALLVGSDYTAGLTGVGPVSAIEIVAHCQPTSEALTPQSRLSKFIRDYKSSNLSKHLMKKLQTLEISEGFPSDEVVKAYITPIVDQSKEKFSWAKPDLGKIRLFMRDKFGWDNRKTDHTLLPILEKFSQSTTQKTIQNYFEWAFHPDEVSTVSKRVGNAVEILTTGVVPSPPKKPKKESPTRKDPKDRLVSSYSRRKYGRFQKDKELETEPVLEGSRAARAAAKAMLAATRKPKAKSALPEPSRSEVGSSGPRNRQTVEEQSSPWNSDSTGVTACSDPLPCPSTSKPSGVSDAMRAPLPSLSDILCGVDCGTPSASEAPSLWTPTRDFVSPYVKRKFGKAAKSQSTPRSASSNPSRPRDTFDRVMPSKTPAQIARERAAKKLKEAKQRAQKKK